MRCVGEGGGGGWRREDGREKRRAEEERHQSYIRVMEVLGEKRSATLACIATVKGGGVRRTREGEDVRRAGNGSTMVTPWHGYITAA